MSIEEAKKLIESVKGRSLSAQERENSAIDLAAHLLNEALRLQTRKERKRQRELARMMSDPSGKAFTLAMTDQCFRSHRSRRIANQLIHLLQQYGLPRYLFFFKRFGLALFQLFGKGFSFLLVPFATFMLRRETAQVILPGEKWALKRHLEKRRKEGVRLNLNHLGEAILSEKEAKKRLQVYLEDLKQDNIDYISIKISTIFSQIHLVDWQETLTQLAECLRELYRAAIANPIEKEGKKVPKFINLDMEEYRDLELTKELFKKVLSENEFMTLSAGIVLQAYLPDAHCIQKELTEWAMERIKKGGAPIKIRIVKGANLAMEKLEANLKGWAQASFKNKTEVDANYKRMVTYGCVPEHARAAHLGIASHNLFDISYALLLRAENRTEKEVSYEMLEGMADHLRRTVQEISGKILLYCPVAKKEDFQSAIAYLIRRLDENTGPENFLRYMFGLKPASKEWIHQAQLFMQSCQLIDKIPESARRSQNRFEKSELLSIDAPFTNERDTDFSLLSNRKWAEEIKKNWHGRSIDPIPLVIAGEEIAEKHTQGEGSDPSYPHSVLYRYSLANWEEIDRALKVAKECEEAWAKYPLSERADLLSSAAQKMREQRADLIGVMMADGGKAILEADPEVSEAIDFAEYYLRTLLKMDHCKDIAWKPKGTILVAPPWNFPASVPTGGILAALAMGNCVLFKPAPEAVLTGWTLVNLLWDSGIPKNVLQFINCLDDPVGSRLIQDERLNAVILTGGTSTAKLFFKLRPGLDLSAETGGKNALIITAMADRDLAIRDLITSAFGHSGQKCSAASLAILEAELYDDPHFLKQLKEATESLAVGSPWHFSSKVTPLIRAASGALLKGLTTLDEEETWLVEPKQDPINPNLWSPGIKLGVKEGSFMHQTELFGPVLAVMRAKNLEEAIRLANGTPYGLTSGIHTLDDREQHIWMEKIVAGNCYINRVITGAIVRRQPFGGTKESSFGHGAKAGGPNYLFQFGHPTQVALPQDSAMVSPIVHGLTPFVKKLALSADAFGLWYASIESYMHWAKHFAEDHDPSQLIGQDNLARYRPHVKIALRIQEDNAPLDVMRILAAALCCKTPLEISFTKEHSPIAFHFPLRELLAETMTFIEESEEKFLNRVKEGVFKRLRLASPPSEAFILAASASATTLHSTPILANGRFELLHYLREIVYSIDYHRYGNLGLREGEKRADIS